MDKPECPKSLIMIHTVFLLRFGLRPLERGASTLRTRMQQTVTRMAG